LSSSFLTEELLGEPPGSLKVRKIVKALPEMLFEVAHLPAIFGVLGLMAPVSVEGVEFI
jgi:hypothetical protein